MVKDNKVVVGSYRNQEEAASVISKLKEDGYHKEDITLYSNSTAVGVERNTKDVEVDTDNVRQTADDGKEDRSFWEKVKDAFSTDTYDYETSAQDPDYNQENDILFPYRDDLINGNSVIVVNNYRGNTSI